MSIPNIGLLLKVTPFLQIIDELSYFVYHNVSYDFNFQFASNLSWNWTRCKFAPPPFLPPDITKLFKSDDPAEKLL